MLHENIKAKLGQGKYLLGLSGGVDSMVLLDKVSKLGLLDQLELLHINHGLREESEWEEQGLRDIAVGYNKHLYVEKLNMEVEEGKSYETEARNLRYKLYREYIVMLGCEGLITGHHSDDLVETMIMRLARGTSEKGIIGISPHHHDEDTGVTKLSGLYGMTKKEIYQYANDNDVIYYEDISNKDTRIPRNNVREKVLPVLEELNTNYAQSFERFSQQMKEMDSYWEYLYSKNKILYAHNYVEQGYYINKNHINGLHELEQRYLLKGLLEELGVEINTVTLGIVMEELTEVRDSNGMTLGNNVVMFTFKNKLYLVKEYEDNGDDLIVDGYVKVDNPNRQRVNGKRINKYISEKGLPLYYRDKNLHVSIDGDELVLGTGESVEKYLYQ